MKDKTFYIDHKTGRVLIAKQGDNDSYTFYATSVSENNDLTNVDLSSLKPIDNIFEYIEKNNLNINGFSKKMVATGGKKNGK